MGNHQISHSFSEVIEDAEGDWGGQHAEEATCTKSTRTPLRSGERKAKATHRGPWRQWHEKQRTT